jgi:hypothetical protein
MEFTVKKALIVSILVFGMTLSVQARDIVDTAVADNGVIHVVGAVPMPHLFV